MAFWLALLPLLKAAGVGAALGAGTAKISGGDVKKGALMGALGGGLGSGFGGLLSGASGGATGAASGAASGTVPGITGAIGGGTGITSQAIGQTLGSVAGKEATKAGFMKLLQDSAIKSGTNAAATGAVSAAIPQYGMTTPGSVPQMTVEDPMIVLQQLMQKSQRRRIV